MVEQRLPNPRVEGSTPSAPAINLWKRANPPGEYTDLELECEDGLMIRTHEGQAFLFLQGHSIGIYTEKKISSELSTLLCKELL